MDIPTATTGPQADAPGAARRARCCAGGGQTKCDPLLLRRHYRQL